MNNTLFGNLTLLGQGFKCVIINRIFFSWQFCISINTWNAFVRHVCVAVCLYVLLPWSSYTRSDRVKMRSFAVSVAQEIAICSDNCDLIISKYKCVYVIPVARQTHTAYCARVTRPHCSIDKRHAWPVHPHQGIFRWHRDWLCASSKGLSHRNCCWD